MDSAMSSRKHIFAVFLLFLGVYLVMIGAQRIYPFLDMPNHLVRATIYKYYMMPGNQFQEYFQVNSLLFSPNVFHIYFCSLFPSVELGNRVFYLLYVVLFPVSVLLLIRKFGGNQWFALLSFLLLYNNNLSMGFAGYTFALPLVLLYLYVLVDYFECGVQPLRGLLVALFLMLIFVTHVIACLFALMIFAVFSMFYGYRNSFSSALMKSVVVIPVIVYMGVWWSSNKLGGGQSLAGFLSEYYRDEFLQTYITRGKLLFLDNYHLFGAYLGYLAGAFFTLIILYPFARESLRFRGGFVVTVARINPYLLMFGASALFCCFFLPNRLPDSWFLYERMSVFLLVSVIIVSSVMYSRELPMQIVALILGATILHAALWGQYFAAFREEVSGFDKNLFPAVKQDEKVSGLMYSAYFRGHPMFNHFPSYHIIWNQGIATTSVIDYWVGVIRRKVDEHQLPHYDSWVGTPYGKKDGRLADMDYLIIKGDKPTAGAEYLAHFRTVKTIGDWSLVNNTRGMQP